MAENKKNQPAAAYDMRFPLARNMICSGPSLSGKSHFVTRLLKHANIYFNPPPKMILWYYGEIQPQPSIQNIEYRQGLPTEEDVKEFHQCIIVLDDLMLESRSSASVANLFTRVAHHRQCFIIHITQNLFQQGAITRTQSLNAHYIVMFKNPRDRLQISHLARQMYPQTPNFLTKAFEDATGIDHGYLLIDFGPTTKDELRVRSNILLGDKQFTVYLPTEHVYKATGITFASST
jgi:hypothetical protein